MAIATADIADWLGSLQLERYTENFLKRGFSSLIQCPDLTEEVLISLGVDLPGHRRRILHRFPTSREQALRIVQATTPENELAPDLPSKQRARGSEAEAAADPDATTRHPLAAWAGERLSVAAAEEEGERGEGEEQPPPVPSLPPKEGRGELLRRRSYENVPICVALDHAGAAHLPAAHPGGECAWKLSVQDPTIREEVVWMHGGATRDAAAAPPGGDGEERPRPKPRRTLMASSPAVAPGAGPDGCAPLPGEDVACGSRAESKDDAAAVCDEVVAEPKPRSVSLLLPTRNAPPVPLTGAYPASLPAAATLPALITSVNTPTPPTSATPAAPPTNATPAPPTSMTLPAQPIGATPASPPTGATPASPPTGATPASPPTGATLASPPTGATPASPPTGATPVPPTGATPASPPTGATPASSPTGATPVPPTGATPPAPPTDDESTMYASVRPRRMREPDVSHVEGAARCASPAEPSIPPPELPDNLRCDLSTPADLRHDPSTSADLRCDPADLASIPPWLVATHGAGVDNRFVPTAVLSIPRVPTRASPPCTGREDARAREEGAAAGPGRDVSPSSSPRFMDGDSPPSATAGGDEDPPPLPPRTFDSQEELRKLEEELSAEELDTADQEGEEEVNASLDEIFLEQGGEGSEVEERPPLPPRRVAQPSTGVMVTNEVYESIESPASAERLTDVGHGGVRVTVVADAEVPGGRSRMKSVKKAMKKVRGATAAAVKHSRRASCNNVVRQNVVYSGYIYKTGSNQKEFQRRCMTLGSGVISYYTEDSRGGHTLKDSVDCKLVLSLERLEEKRAGRDNCFEVNTVKDKSRVYLFSTELPHQRSEWMQKIVQSVAPSTLVTNCCTGLAEVERSGYLYIMDGSHEEWQLCWLDISAKHLLWAAEGTTSMNVLDLRKSTSIYLKQDGGVVMQEGGGGYVEEGPMLVVVTPGRSLRLRADMKKETVAWHEFMRRTTIVRRGVLEDQQLTQENVPVIVTKCLDFIGVHGLSSEGIYRKSGQDSVVSRLLNEFYEDAHGVFLKQDGEYSEHDVTNCLKRFFRNLSEPLLTQDLYQLWMQTSEVAVESAKLSKYKSIINELSEINYQTLKKLLCHLNSIVSNCYQNHMTVTNLAVVFSPTIMSMRQEDEQFPDKQELVVVMDLISHYRYLFEVDPNENQKDMIIRQKMEELQQLQSVKAQNAGNFHIPFFIHNLEGESNNIQVSNYTTAQEIVEFAINRKWLSGDHSKWSVYEIICNQDLQRPLHYAERVFEVALQHSQFPCSESNALCIKPNSLYRGVLNLAEQPFSLFSEIFYGDRLKQFRKASAEFSNAKLTIYKSAEGQRKLGTWNIEDIKWYIGAEKSRIPPTQWPITFLELDATRKHDQWVSKGFGKVISCLSSQERDKWVAAMLLGQYPRDLLPPEKLIDI